MCDVRFENCDAMRWCDAADDDDVDECRARAGLGARVLAHSRMM